MSYNVCVVFLSCQANLSASNLRTFSKQKEMLTKELDTFKYLKQALENLLRETEYQQVRNTKHQFNNDIACSKGILFLKLGKLKYWYI